MNDKSDNWRSGYNNGLLHTRPGTFDNAADIRKVFDAKSAASNPDFIAGYQVGIDTRLEAEAICVAINKALLGTLIPVLRRIFAARWICRRVLLGVSDEVRAILNDQYKARYGESLAHAGKSAFGGRFKRLVPIMLVPNTEQADAARLLLKLQYLPVTFIAALEQIVKEQRADLTALTDQCEILSKEVLKLPSFSSLMKRTLNVRDYRRAALLLSGDLASSDSYLIGYLLFQPSQNNVAKICHKLLERSLLERREINTAFLALWGESLEQALMRQVRTGALLDLACAIIHEDSDRENAALLRAGIEKLPGFWPGKEFLKKTAAERNKRCQAYKDIYGVELESDIKRRFNGNEEEVLLELMHSGAVSWGMLFYLCVAHIGTDEDGLRSLLEHSSPEQLHTARTEFKTLWQMRAPWYERPFPHLLSDLERRVWIETGGDTWVDFQEYFIDAPQETDELRERMERLYNHERSGKLLKKLIFFSREGALMDQDVKIVREFYEKNLKAQPANPALQERFKVLVHYAEIDCGTFRALKHFIGNSLTSVVAASTAFGAAVALSVVKLPLLSVMADVAIISIVVRLTLKSLLKGRGYHVGEVFADFLFGIMDGATLFTAVLFRQAIIRSGTKFVTKFGFRSGVTRLSRIVGQSKLARYGISLPALAEAPE